MAMRTVGDLIRVLNYYKENYPEFEKYNLCIDVADDEHQGDEDDDTADDERDHNFLPP